MHTCVILTMLRSPNITPPSKAGYFGVLNSFDDLDNDSVVCHWDDLVATMSGTDLLIPFNCRVERFCKV